MAEAKGKKSMVIYHDWIELFEDFNDEEVGQLLLALLRFDIDGTESKFSDKAMRITYKQLKATVKRDRETYTEKCEKNRERINNYWSRRNTKVNERIPTYSNRTDSDSDSDNDNDSDNDSGSGSDIYIQPTLQQITDYFHNNNYNSDPKAFYNYNTAKGWMMGGSRVADWKRLADRWEAKEPAKKKGGDPGDIGFDW